MSEGRFDLSTFRSERTNEASTLTITPKRSSSRDVVEADNDERNNQFSCYQCHGRIKAWANWALAQGFGHQGASSRYRLSLNNSNNFKRSPRTGNFGRYVNWPHIMTVVHVQTYPAPLLIQSKGGYQWSDWPEEVLRRLCPASLCRQRQLIGGRGIKASKQEHLCDLPKMAR
ncbi:hypothetical protein TNCV_4623851 [Trichonephila clavipes]|nr:hypothetical protein TNCV_4623851 [Trichonephila clavipes]